MVLFDSKICNDQRGRIGSHLERDPGIDRDDVVFYNTGGEEVQDKIRMKTKNQEPRTKIQINKNKEEKIENKKERIADVKVFITKRIQADLQGSFHYQDHLYHAGDSIDDPSLGG